MVKGKGGLGCMDGIQMYEDDCMRLLGIGFGWVLKTKCMCPWAP